MVAQPKSIATVVVVLPVAWPGSSTPTPAEVMTASVVSGEISLIAPTVVVLPTPKPPATTILTGIGGACSGDRTKSTDHSQDGVGVGTRGLPRVDVEVAGGPQVADQDAGHAQVQPGLRRDLGERDGLRAERHDR